jgi:gas vesicle protein
MYTTRVIIIRKSKNKTEQWPKEKKGKLDNIMAIRKRTNNDLQYTTQKTNDRATQTLLKVDNKTEVFQNVDTYKWKIHNGKI